MAAEDGEATGRGTEPSALMLDRLPGGLGAARSYLPRAIDRGGRATTPVTGLPGTPGLPGLPGTPIRRLPPAGPTPSRRRVD